jgi:endonuclease/exonuclease/phosphatase family metal-dependent hydrolase
LKTGRGNAPRPAFCAHPEAPTRRTPNPIRGARARNLGRRIDYFFVSDELRDRVKAAGIMPHVQGSDHCPISLTLDD